MLITIIAIILHQISSQRQLTNEVLHRQEVLNVAQMAVQIQEDELSLNGVRVRVERRKDAIVVFSDGQEIVRVSEN
ncbi:competence type IV pilus minor pilin ComGE [Streptococcus cuniculipharyngis]|nr:competence type IV pilus minor pilin ComGE [Streptococcus cuniculipharyngis]